jgi:hypothetical protein
VVRGVALLQGRADHSGIEVSLESMPEKSTITDATGNFTLSELGDGPYVLLFSHEGYQSETWADVVPSPATAPVTSGVVTLRPINQEAGIGVLQGIVLLRNQAAHANTLVRLLGVPQLVTTDNAGRYMFIGVPAGEYTLTAQHVGYASEEVTRVPVLAEQISVAPEIILEPTITVADQKGMGSIQGVAILEGEIDHGGITVAIEGSSLMAMTDVNGNYEISNVPEGTYTLLFTKGDYRNAYVPQVSVTAQEPAMVQMVILERDVEPPYVVDTYPANGSRRVPIINGFVDILVQFSERMDGSSVKAACIIEPPVSYDAFFDRESELSQQDVLHLRLYQNAPVPVLFKTGYRITITPQAQTIKGVAMAEPYSFAFTTDGPLIVSTFPSLGDNEMFVTPYNPIIVDTNAIVDPASVEKALRIRPQADAMPEMEYIYHETGTRILIKTTLRMGARYTLQLDNNLRTRDGMRFSNTPFSISFRTETLQSAPEDRIMRFPRRGR